MPTYCYRCAYRTAARLRRAAQQAAEGRMGRCALQRSPTGDAAPPGAAVLPLPAATARWPAPLTAGTLGGPGWTLPEVARIEQEDSVSPRLEVMITFAIAVASCVGSDPGSAPSSEAGSSVGRPARVSPGCASSIPRDGPDCAGCVHVSHPALGNAGCLRTGAPPNLQTTAAPRDASSCDPACCGRP